MLFPVLANDRALELWHSRTAPNRIQNNLQHKMIDRYERPCFGSHRRLQRCQEPWGDSIGLRMRVMQCCEMFIDPASVRWVDLHLSHLLHFAVTQHRNGQPMLFPRAFLKYSVPDHE
jgi:hypothetical protein